MRLALAPGIAAAAAFDGWSAAALDSAAQACRVNPDVAHLAFAGRGDGVSAMAMIAAWITHVDAVMAAALSPEALAAMPVRARITALVRCRLDAIAGCEEGLSRALAIMAMPQNAGAALKLGWHSADAMWRLAGDRAADYNHYTKRAILGSIYAATLSVFATDTSADKAETLAFLGRRIAEVMAFEKAKARVMNTPREYFSPVRFLGRLRYPAA